MGAGTEYQPWIQYNRQPIFVSFLNPAGNFPGRHDPKSAMGKAFELFSEPLVVRHLIVVNQLQLGLLVQQPLDLSVCRARKKKNGIFPFFPVADKIFWNQATVQHQAAFEIVDK